LPDNRHQTTKEEGYFTQENVANSKPAPAKDALGSYKGNVGSLRSDDEYRRLSIELNKSVEEIKEMDESIYESTSETP
jgi:hypothetical protein